MYELTENNQHTGIDIVTTDVYSICNGVVIHIGKEIKTNKYEITVQYNAKICVRYCNLSTVNIRAGSIVMDGDLLGCSEDFVHFEYVTTLANGSKHIVRVGKVTYYKQDPEPILLGKIVLPKNTYSEIVIVNSDTMFNDVVFTDDMLNEFNGDNRGEPYVQF